MRHSGQTSPVLFAADCFVLVVEQLVASAINAKVKSPASINLADITCFVILSFIVFIFIFQCDLCVRGEPRRVLGENLPALHRAEM